MSDAIKDYGALLLGDVPLLDVRAPVEFAKGAFPHATNLPLLNDQERHEIGICYSRKGQQAAIELGHKLVSGELRDERIRAWQAWCAQHPDGVIYCFRGGLRSQTVQAWLAEAGISRPLVAGGYKALRRFLLESFERDIHRQPLLILSGRTGTGKTRVIEALPRCIDLEGIAHHRGSAFGRRPGGQPSQIDFENRLSIDLLKRRAEADTELVLEDESRLIGRCHLPPVLQDRMKASPRVMIEEDLESRVQVTLDDYVRHPLQEFRQLFGEEPAFEKLADSLLDSLDRIRKRLGGARHQQLRESMAQALDRQRREGDSEGHREWIRPLLRDYYDPMYDYMLTKRDGDVLFTGTRDEVSDWLASRTTP